MDPMLLFCTVCTLRIHFARGIKVVTTRFGNLVLESLSFLTLSLRITPLIIRNGKGRIPHSTS